MDEFGSELKRLREGAGMSLAAFALAVPASKGYLSKIENGKANVSRDIANACDRALKAGGRLAALATHTAESDRLPAPGMVGLPAGTRHFIGRASELAKLSSILVHQDAIRVCVVHGMAGVGKTAIAIAAARSAIDDFPDGCLFFDLRGHTPGAPVLSPADGLRRVLGMLDVPAEKIPADVDGRANLFQAHLRGRRMLLVFDNVRTADQVRLMLPAEPGCRVVITSRGRLPALDDAWPISLDLLSPADSTALFRSVAGPSVSVDDDVVADLVAYCGTLPLAIRIAAARLVAGGWSAARLMQRLADQRTRLTSLDDGERSVAAAFKVSYDSLPDDQRWLFGLLALHPATTAEPAAVHALADLPPGETDRLLDRLHDAHLLTLDPHGHVELHDLMRTFAVRYALPEIGEAERAAAAGRLVDYALTAVHAADRLVEPHRFRPTVDTLSQQDIPFTDAHGALAWLREQWPALTQIIELAARYGRHRHCWQLTYILRSFYFRERLLDPWIRTHELALGSARQAGDVAGAGMILNNLGMVHLEVGDVAAAVDCHNRAEAHFEQVMDERGATDAVSSRAWAFLSMGNHAAAQRDLTRTLAIYRRTGRTRNTVIALRGLAFVLTELEQFDEALSHAQEARDLAQLPSDVLMTLNCFAWVHFHAGRLDEAERQYQGALDLAEFVDSDYELTRAIIGMGNIAAMRGDRDLAKQWWARADEHGVVFNPLVLGEARARLDFA
ncbi:transcriptional regulator [Actinosynnema sp. ALI-1.44]|uniref:helix-turn-helix domain-containing protein n=1 Tax=Actinosynnema sp. ALI-1.44 TaxID=1933779 RepID=UPI00097C9542|nr:helix-turn-helix domain-containing protein [Actinosynnema sp. ALI-1.44]ONI70526.1 transcriptional regulator [Actinosynnema sp. ALI-1.44]